LKFYTGQVPLLKSGLIAYYRLLPSINFDYLHRANFRAFLGAIGRFGFQFHILAVHFAANDGSQAVIGHKKIFRANCGATSATDAFLSFLGYFHSTRRQYANFTNATKLLAAFMHHLHIGVAL